MIIKAKLLSPTAKLPRKAGEYEAGWDFYSDEDLTLLPRTPQLVNLGVSLELPEGWAFVLKDRSSLARKGVHVLGGVMDCTYRGPYMATLVFLKGRKFGPFYVRRGDRVCQGLLVPVPSATVEVVNTLSPSYREGGAFGSTGR